MATLNTKKFGPFKGYQSSVEAVMAPDDFIVGNTSGAPGAGSSRDVVLDPASGMWFRRKGCAIVGDTLSGSTPVSGLLESGMVFGAMPRKGVALRSPSMTDGRSTRAVLFGSDSNSASFPTVDTGWHGTMYVRNTNGSGENYNLLRDFGSSHYPTNTGTFVPSSSGLIVCPPLWYESGEGGYHRGAHRYDRQKMAAGSRTFIVAGRHAVFPNLRGTPLRWDMTLNNVTGSATTNTTRYFPLGPFPPLPTTSIGTQTASTGNDATWTDGDTFYYSVIFKFEDGSYSQPTLPRPVNALLAGGIGQRVVGTIGGTATYRSVTWTGIPIGPTGTIARLLLRSPKQARTASTDAITISPYDLRVTGILTNNTQTSYIDTTGSDVGLIENDNIVRLDTVCPRRARYFWTGDQRLQSGYTLPSPCAIMLAPTGTTTANDLNVADDSVTAQGTTGYVYRITSTAIELYQYTASTTLGTAYSIDYATYTTLQDVVDRINATTVASSCKQWRAQICPGADASAASSTLCQSTHQVANCTTGGGSSTTLTTSGSFANVPIGYYITGTGVTTGTYVVSKQSNTSLTMSAAMTVAAATTLDFSAYTGDGTGAANYWSGNVVGLMRAFCPAYPGFIYFKRSAVPGYDVPDKQRVFFTVGSPGAASAGSSVAVNTWGADNFRLPTISNPGNILGGVDIEGASVIGYSGGIALFKNVKGVNSGEDFDYKLFTINGSRGPCHWNALVGGNGWASYTTREGIFATDKNLREFSLSGAIYNATRGLGDLAYSIDNAVAETDADTDGVAILTMSVMRSKLVVAFQESSTGNLCAVWYDYSPGLEASGVEELANPDSKEPYGWSSPCVYNATANSGLMSFFSVPTSSGMSYFGCCPANYSATADGRIDQIETGNADNGTAFVGYAYLPHFISDDFTGMSPQRLQVLHKKPNGTSNTVIKVSRDQTFAASNSYTLTSSGSNQFTYEIVQLKSSTDRGRTDMVWLLWQDSETTQGNGFWSIAMQFQTLPL